MEADEFIYLKNFRNIKKYLKNVKFNKCQRIQLNWIFHTDNNLLYYQNKSLKIRFPEIEENAKKNKSGIRQAIKSILKGHIPRIEINCVHSLNAKLKSCDGFGNYKKFNGIFTLEPDFRYYYFIEVRLKIDDNFEIRK